MVQIEPLLEEVISNLEPQTFVTDEEVLEPRPWRFAKAKRRGVRFERHVLSQSSEFMPLSQSVSRAERYMRDTFIARCTVARRKQLSYARQLHLHD